MCGIMLSIVQIQKHKITHLHQELIHKSPSLLVCFPVRNRSKPALQTMIHKMLILKYQVCDMNRTAEANSAFDWCLLLPSCLCGETRSSQGLKGVVAFPEFRAKASKVSVHCVHFPTNDISSKSSTQVRLLFHDGEIFCRFSPLWHPSPQRRRLLFIKADPLTGDPPASERTS